MNGCVPFKMPNAAQSKEIKAEKNNDEDWELIVMDAQYENFLTVWPQPKSRYTEHFLKSKNTFLVQEWNSYFHRRAYPNVVEATLQYDANEKYGLEFEYHLYQVFAMVNSRYGLPFMHLPQMDRKK